jgi:hypothetical protein
LLRRFPTASVDCGYPSDFKYILLSHQKPT